MSKEAYMKTVSLIDTSSFESHVDGLVGMMSIMAIAQRDEHFEKAYKDLLDLVNTRDDLTLEEKQEVMDKATAHLKVRVDGFVESRKAKGYFK
jgi:hypothetical protein|tara:strand:+ start:832 stop:1110 length:279 start_codon:yes stop_codon:yes gene_type:complete